MTAWHVIGAVWSLTALFVVGAVVAGGVQERRQRRRDVERALRTIPPDDWMRLADAVQRPPLLSERSRSWTALDDSQFRRAVERGA